MSRPLEALCESLCRCMWMRSLHRVAPWSMSKQTTVLAYWIDRQEAVRWNVSFSLYELRHVLIGQMVDDVDVAKWPYSHESRFFFFGKKWTSSSNGKVEPSQVTVFTLSVSLSPCVNHECSSFECKVIFPVAWGSFLFFRPPIVPAVRKDLFIAKLKSRSWKRKNSWGMRRLLTNAFTGQQRSETLFLLTKEANKLSCSFSLGVTREEKKLFCFVVLFFERIDENKRRVSCWHHRMMFFRPHF